MNGNSSIDDFFEKQAFAKEGLLKLRDLLLSKGLKETLKWGTPVYTFQNKNIVGIGSFKSYFGLWYFQGALLKDEKEILINAQEGKTKALRQLRFNTSSEIDEEVILSYTDEAIENQRAGKEIKVVRAKTLSLPLELKNILDKDNGFANSFKSLSPGKQREYAEFIASAKRENTRLTRLEKCIPMIFEGKGLNEHYKK